MFRKISSCLLVVEDVEYTKRQVSKSQQSLIMCKVTGALLANHVIHTSTTRFVKDCVKLCLQNPGCVSLNYVISSETCELNDAVSSDYEIRKSADYNNLWDPDFIHYTTQSGCSFTY